MTKYTEQSLETKNRLSAALKKLMKKKDFQKISINDLTREAKLNRNSFYYHFNNIYDLLKYTFENDATAIFQRIDLNHNMDRAVSSILKYLDKNKAFCMSAYKSLGKAELRKFLHRDFYDIVEHAINRVIAEHHFQISADCREYIIYSYTELMVAHIIGYLENAFGFSKKSIVDYIMLTFNSSVIASLETAHQRRL